jgi:hypothetical protein
MVGVLHAFMDARYQDPVRGQFMSEDPVFLNVSNTDAVGAPSYATIGLVDFTGGTPSSETLYLASPSSHGGSGTFTFGGLTYAKLFSGVTTNGKYARQ